MEDDLLTLIKELETEKENLLRLVDKAVQEQDFLSAHFHFEAVTKANRQLQTLKNLNDEMYDQKHLLEVGIGNLRKRLEHETDDNVKSALGRFMAEKERELIDLHQRPKQTTGKNDSNLLKNYLDSFLKKKLRGLRVVISKSNNLLIEIRRSGGGVKLTIPNIRKLEKQHLLYERQFAKLKGLGFVLNTKAEKLTMLLQNDHHELSKKIETVLSLIVFEVFYFKQLGKDACIEIVNKQTGQND